MSAACSFRAVDQWLEGPEGRECGFMGREFLLGNENIPELDRGD